MLWSSDTSGRCQLWWAVSLCKHPGQWAVLGRLNLLWKGHCSHSRDCIHWFLSFQLCAGSWIISKWEISKLGCSQAVNLSLLIQHATFFSERAEFQWSVARSLWSNGILVTQEQSPPAIDSRAPSPFPALIPALINGNNAQIIAAANSWMLLAWSLNSGEREPPVGCKHSPVLPNNP